MNADLLRRSWAEASRFGDRLVLHFYSRLFLAHPEVRPLFGQDMAEQRKKLAQTLNMVVAGADRLDKLVPVLQRLGVDHRRFGATADHYQAVGSALVDTLEHFLGEGWMPEVAQAWTEAYGAVADVMITAAREADRLHEARWWDCRVLDVRMTRMMDTAYIVFGAPDIDPVKGMVVPAALHGRPGDWLPIEPFPVDGGWATYVAVTDDPLTLAFAQARPGDVLRLGAPVDPVDPKEEP